ncbi:MAG: glycosyltransferase family 2 protein [Bryobacteraceae bacterium]
MDRFETSTGVVIVTHNSSEVIGDCLDALGGLRVVVVDNASADDTVARASGRLHVAVIANLENRGFAGGVNQGIAALDCDLILILNPDAVIVSPLESLAAACREFGLAAGRLIDAGGQTQVGFTIRRFPTPLTLTFEVLGVNSIWPGNPVNRRYRYLDRDALRAGPVEQPAGAFLMLRRDVWREAGGLDESFYPVWFEDVDFCLRARQLGIVGQYVPEVVARHVGGHSVGQIPEACRPIYWYVSLLRYAFKHFSTVQARGIAVAVILGAIPRAVLGIVLERNLKPLGVYLKVVRLGGQCAFAIRASRFDRVKERGRTVALAATGGRQVKVQNNEAGEPHLHGL